LKAFLAGSVPELESDNAIIDCNFFGEEVGAYGCFVGCGELLVDLGRVRLGLQERARVDRTYILVH